MIGSSKGGLSLGQSSEVRAQFIDLRVLLVDDDSTTLAVVSSMLKVWKYKVETAKNPLDALSTLRLQNGHFDLVVTDLHMPFMNGFDLQKQIDKEFKLPVILMSADDHESVLEKSLQSGIVSYILKPVKPNDLKNLWQFVDKTRKGKSVAIEETRTDIAHNSLSRRPNNINLGGFDHPIIPFGGGVGGPRFGESVPRNNNRGGNKRTRDDGDDGDSGRTSSKKPCNRKDPNNNNNNNDNNNNNNKSPNNNKNTNYKKPMIKRRKRPNKAKIVWTNSLHNRFLLAIRHLGYNTVPKKILEFMNVPGLTRENVASHLQKYRLFLKRVAENGILGVTKLLTDKFMRSSFANGYPVDLILQHAREMYPQLYRKAVERQLQDQQIRQQLLGQQSTSPVPQPQAPTTTSFHGASSSRGPAPVGLPTLLMDNRPAPPSNIVRQPFLHSTSYNANNTPVGIATVLQNSGTDNQGPSAGFPSRNHSINNNNNNNAGSSCSAGGSNIGPRVLTRFSQQAGTNIAYGPVGITLVDSNFSHDNNNVVRNPTPAPFPGCSPSQGAGGNNETVEIDDNIFGNNAIDMDMNINDLLGDDNSDVGGQFGSNNQLGFEDYDNTFGLDTDLFSPGLLNDIVQQPISQVQGNDQVVLNSNDDVLPFDFIPFQNEGLEQIFPSSNTGYAIPSDNYYSGINLISLQAPQGIGQVMQNPGGNNIESLGGIEQILQNPTNNNVQPLGNDQIVQNLENFDNSLPLLDTYFPDPLNQITPLPNVPSTVNNVPPFDAYVPSLDILPQPSVDEEFGAFQQIDHETLHNEMDWDEFIGCMLNEDVPDLRD